MKPKLRGTGMQRAAIYARYSSELQNESIDWGSGRRGEERKAEVLSEVRRLVQCIMVYPHGDLQMRDLELLGELAGLMGTAATSAYGGRKMVAEEGLEPPTRGL